MKKILVLLVLLLLVSQTFNTSIAMEPKRGALILVNYDKDKSLFSELIARERNFDFPIDIILNSTRS